LDRAIDKIHQERRSGIAQKGRCRQGRLPLDADFAKLAFNYATTRAKQTTVHADELVVVPAGQVNQR
jgi:hypothetical protein